MLVFIFLYRVGLILGRFRVDFIDRAMGPELGQRVIESAGLLPLYPRDRR